MAYRYEHMNFGDTLVTQFKVKSILEKIEQTKELKGSIAEVGVYKGGTAKIIFDNMISGEKLFLFDTFTGIPNKSDSDNEHGVGDFSDSCYDQIVEHFKDFSNVEIHKGIFPQDTGKAIGKRKFKLVHLDVDTYLSYKEGLEFFYNKMVVGGIIILDDYKESTCEGATLAVDQFLADKKEVVQFSNSYYIVKEK